MNVQFKVLTIVLASNGDVAIGVLAVKSSTLSRAATRTSLHVPRWRA
jgi:hypothetical protein